MDDLQQLRKQIDEIDDQILKPSAKESKYARPSAQPRKSKELPSEIDQGK